MKMYKKPTTEVTAVNMKFSLCDVSVNEGGGGGGVAGAPALRGDIIE